MKSVVLGVGGLLLVACPRPSPAPPDGGCPLASGTEQEFWKSLALVYQQCLLSHSTAECRANTEQLEWFPVFPSSANGVDINGLQGPALNTALASPAAHLAAANQPSLAAAFFALTADQVGSAMRVTVTPVDRSHQAVLGATLTAGWVCASDAGC